MTPTGDRDEELIPVSVVIPAHDEAAVIGRCLDALMRGARPGEIEVVVVCNGCSDHTAAKARAGHPEVSIVELAEASKPAALNAGDQRATRFPRVYLDADVELPIVALRAIARALTDPDVLCAAPVPEFELRGRPLAVRKYYEVWQQLPYIKQDMVGTGVYGLSEHGRARFDEFPAITADDQFVLQQFDRSERRSVHGERFRVHTPMTLRGLVTIRRRAYRGITELKATCLAPHAPATGSGQQLLALARTPRNLPGIAFYIAISLYAKASARITHDARWERDSSARLAASGDDHSDPTALESSATAEDAPTIRSARVAYIVSHYPALSHTFIQREVLALRELGTEVDVFSIHRTASTVMSNADVAELASTFAVLPVSLPALVSAHARAFRRSPRAYVRILRYALSCSPRGARALLWQVFYFAEAIIVWNRCRARGVRHLHAHFANVGADVAWLAAEFGQLTDGPASWSWSFTMHGCIEFWNVDRFNLARKVTAADLVIAISEFTRAQLMGFVEPEHWDKVTVVHCGVDLDRYQPSSSRSTRDADSVEVLCVGRLSAEKGQALLLRAIGQLVHTGKEVRLTLVGDGPLRRQLEDESARLGIEHAVTFTGAVDQDEIPAYYRRADVFCQPSFMEGIPVVLMEAMASGLPVVSSGVAGIPELVIDGHSGLLIPPGRPCAFAKAIGQLVDSPALRVAMGRAGRAIVEREFAAAHCARQVATLFRTFDARGTKTEN
jgi:glycosyltransferase involved in cell wall biosynthesis